MSSDSNYGVLPDDPELIAEIQYLAKENFRLTERIRFNLEAAEFQRKKAFKAGYHCRWHKDVGSYCFDPEMCPGDPDGAYKAWLRRLEDVGIRASMDAGREP
jgi:hypothetical protein